MGRTIQSLRKAKARLRVKRCPRLPPEIWCHIAKFLPDCYRIFLRECVRGINPISQRRFYLITCNLVRYDAFACLQYLVNNRNWDMSFGLTQSAIIHNCSKDTIQLCYKYDLMLCGYELEDCVVAQERVDIFDILLEYPWNMDYLLIESVKGDVMQLIKCILSKTKESIPHFIQRMWRCLDLWNYFPYHFIHWTIIHKCNPPRSVALKLFKAATNPDAETNARTYTILYTMITAWNFELTRDECQELFDYGCILKCFRINQCECGSSERHL